MTPRIRFHATNALILVPAAVAFTVLATGQPVNASEQPDNVTAVWYAQGTELFPADGQTLQASKPSSMLDLAFVQATADALGCGYTIQGDLYVDDATTAALIAAGKLFAPGTAAESWPNGQYLPEYSTVFYTGDCVEVVVPEPSPTPTATPEPTATPIAVSPAPVEPPATPRDTASDVQAAAKTAAPELAVTGVDMATPTGVAFLFILGGVILASVKHMKKRESK